MRVLQLGNEDWSQKYTLPEGIEWHFNDFPEKIKENEKKQKGYLVVIITSGAKLEGQYWNQLYWLIDPYHVLYTADVKENLSEEGKLFLNKTAAEKISEDFQTVIDHLEVRYFFGQSGIRIFPDNIALNSMNLSEYEFLDAGNLKIKVNTHEKWLNLGSYRQSLYIDANRLVKLWLTLKEKNISVRLRVFIQDQGGDGDPNDSKELMIDTDQELYLPISPSKNARFACVMIDIKGNGELILGVLHSRWGRDGRGEFIAGGKRIVNHEKREDIAYYFNPGDLKPPLNVYFSGARGLEGFEAFPLFRRLGTPSLLFTDMRLSVGQFYDDDDDNMGSKIKAVILKTLDRLGFDTSQLLMNGISMGTYPALKYGAELGAYAINVAKPIGNLGYVATRSRMDRPDEFDTIFDIDNQLVSKLDDEHLSELDKKFWLNFDKQDLSNTKLFVGYMKNDDYDNKAIDDLLASSAIKQSKQFSYKGFPGRHNDSREVNIWFVDRLNQILQQDFKRK